MAFGIFIGMLSFTGMMLLITKNAGVSVASMMTLFSILGFGFTLYTKTYMWLTFWFVTTLLGIILIASSTGVQV